MLTKARLITLTFLLWLIGCALYCYWYITSILAQPGFDAYAYSVGFQFLAFMIVRFPFLLMALPAIICIEVLLYEIFISSKKHNP